MCCHDWGAKHCIGYLDKDGISSNDKDLKQVYDKTQLKQKGFELLKNIKMQKSLISQVQQFQHLHKFGPEKS